MILYVMLCGRLPFDDEYIPTLFKKINSGIYTLPSYLSAEAASLLSAMLVVDPVKRITIQEIRQLPWFQKDLPKYLYPLPSTPAPVNDASTKEFDFNMTPARKSSRDMNDGNGALQESKDSSSSTGTTSPPAPPQSQSYTPQTIYTPDLGYLQRSIVHELQSKMVSFNAEEILDLLQQPGDNQLKVAYQLVRDHRRMIQTSEIDGNEELKEEMKAWLAASPPAWNEGLEERRAKHLAQSEPSSAASASFKPSRQTSIKRPTRRSTRDIPVPSSAQNLSGSHELSEGRELTDDGNETFASDTADSEMADADADAADAAALDSGISDDEGLRADDDMYSDEDLDQPPASGAPCGIAVLETSIPSRRPWAQDGSADGGSGATGTAAAPPAAPTPSKRSRPRWHFGIRSRSPPMEIIMELYRTLEALGMEWRVKPKKQQRPNDQDEGADAEEAPSDNARELFFIETRWKLGNAIVRMDLQLYSVDSSNYLVDFRNVAYIRLDPTPPLTRRASHHTDVDGDGDADADADADVEADDDSQRGKKVERALDAAANEAQEAEKDRERAQMKKLLGRSASKPSLAPALPEGRKEVCSPFLFLECATRLM